MIVIDDSIAFLHIQTELCDPLLLHPTLNPHVTGRVTYDNSSLYTQTAEPSTTIAQNPERAFGSLDLSFPIESMRVLVSRLFASSVAFHSTRPRVGNSRSAAIGCSPTSFVDSGFLRQTAGHFFDSWVSVESVVYRRYTEGEPVSAVYPMMSNVIVSHRRVVVRKCGQNEIGRG